MPSLRFTETTARLIAGTAGRKFTPAGLVVHSQYTDLRKHDRAGWLDGVTEQALALI